MQKIVYRLCKNKINGGIYETQEDMQMMLDVFFAGERITAEQYQELSELLSNKHSGD